MIRDMLKETPIFRSRPRPEPSPHAQEVIARIKAIDDATKPHVGGMIDPANMPEDDRRATVKALLVALAGAGIVFSLGGREVKAQDIGGDIDDLIDSITNIEQFMQQLLELFNRVFAIVPGVPLPPFVRQMITQLLRDLIGLAGDDSFSGDPVGAMGRSFPDDPAVVETPNARRAFGQLKLTALRARGDEALQQAAQVTAGQEQMSVDEETIAVTAGGTGNLLAMMAAELALTASTSGRIGTLAHTLQAMTTLAGDQQLQQHAEMQLKEWANEDILGPIPEPAPVGILPGGQ